uniref:Uncharacterized protein n=1 Tax=Romanomermis culicivorax TaxID=13658 RepID=A0A915LAX9_ROMCU
MLNMNTSELTFYTFHVACPRNTNSNLFSFNFRFKSGNWKTRRATKHFDSSISSSFYLDLKCALNSQNIEKFPARRAGSHYIIFKIGLFAVFLGIPQKSLDELEFGLGFLKNALCGFHSGR